MVDKHLAKAIADVVIFLEFSNEDVLNADASVAALEQLAAELQNTSDAVRAELSQCFNDLSKEYGERASFVAGLAETLGLV